MQLLECLQEQRQNWSGNKKHRKGNFQLHHSGNNVTFRTPSCIAKHCLEETTDWSARLAEKQSYTDQPTSNGECCR